MNSLNPRINDVKTQSPPPKSLGKVFFQPKLTINQPNDIYEQEADHMADKVMRMPDPSLNQNAFFKPAVSHVQRKCQACEEEDKFVHRKEESSGEVKGSSGLDSYVGSLHTSGQQMPQAARSFFEPRFGHDFSNVRIHTDSVAAKSAQSINALAYTSGSNIVFNSGQYAPDTDSGKRLMAHELTHVVQQGKGTARKIQRQEAPLRPTDISSCRIHFIHGSTEFVDANELTTCMEQIRNYLRINADGHIVLHGYASEEGGAEYNMTLSRRRDEAVLRRLRAAGIDIGRVSTQTHGEDTTYDTLPGNRRVEVEMSRSITFTDEPVTGRRPPPPPRYICGPDVTRQVEDVVNAARTRFGGWSNDQRTESCNALSSLITGGMAWDIVDLHNNAWILSYRPACASDHATPRCGSSVQIGTGCHYAGSVNYVIFGTMCRLCADHFLRNGPINTGYANFTLSGMMHMIDLYKGHGLSGLATPSANFHESEVWAYAGYMGWPAVGNPTTPDRSNCSPTCPTPFTGSRFTFHWYPLEFD